MQQAISNEKGGSEPLGESGRGAARVRKPAEFESLVAAAEFERLVAAVEFESLIISPLRAR